jgi:outer membrane protein assembly factor BamB
MPRIEPVRHTFDDLAVWRTQLPGIQHAVLPPSSDRPNPRLSGEFVYVSVFAPGFIYALDASTGNIRWQWELSYLGDSSVETYKHLVLAKTARCLYALDATFR